MQLTRIQKLKMQKFDQIESIIAPLKLDNVDTDMIIPKQFLKTIKRTGLGVNLFHEMRYDLDEKPIADFILNQDKYKNSQILLSGDNFGCGSSREHAPWALVDFGIRVVIASSYADIFYNNCFKNSILPITLNKTEIQKIWDKLAKGDNSALVDLESQEIRFNDDSIIKFDLDSFRKKSLIEGLDDIDLSLLESNKIQDFEQKQRVKEPWLYNNES